MYVYLLFRESINFSTLSSSYISSVRLPTFENSALYSLNSILLTLELSSVANADNNCEQSPNCLTTKSLPSVFTTLNTPRV